MKKKNKKEKTETKKVLKHAIARKQAEKELKDEVTKKKEEMAKLEQ